MQRKYVDTLEKTKDGTGKGKLKCKVEGAGMATRHMKERNPIENEEQEETKKTEEEKDNITRKRHRKRWEEKRTINVPTKAAKQYYPPEKE